MVAEIFLLQRLLPDCQLRQIKGCLALFPKIKKVRTWARTRGRNCSLSRAHPRRRLSWRVSSRMQPASGCSSQVVGGNFWARTQKSGCPGEGLDGALVMRQPTSACGSISSHFPVFRARAVRHLESGTLFPLRFVSGSHVPCVCGCCLWSTALDFSGDSSATRGRFSWFDSGYMFCISPGRLEKLHTVSA